MALRGKKPEKLNKRLKLFMFGAAGVGKTMAAIQMPRPYVIDCEHGTDHYGKIINESDGDVFQTTSMDEAIAEVRSLVSDKHTYQTLVIDPVTSIYQDLLDECEKKVGTEWGRHYGEANKHMKRLANLIMTLDMNVVVTAHAKAEYGAKMERVGETFDGWKRLDYMFDLVLNLKKIGQQRMAVVTKTRISAFPDGSQFEWSYDAVANRYGKNLLEKPHEAIALASDEQVQEFTSLLAKLAPDEMTRMGIARAMKEFESISDMPADRIAKGIQLVNDHLKKEKGTSI